MCGIFLYCGHPRDLTTLQAAFVATKHRGPDYTRTTPPSTIA